MKYYSRFYHKIRLKSNFSNPSTTCQFVVNPSKLSPNYPELLSTSRITHYHRISALFFLIFLCAEKWSLFVRKQAPFFYARIYVLFGIIGFAFRALNFLQTTPVWGGVNYA